ncbi:NUDIX hydrolase [Desulfurivibrio dismutans]|uniref:NUDIX hydrolase n=1 Tax=Desulfurivibrio dismutans TaxID=1398908 RepID=UPI0023DC9B14|nr:NUDIX hydrolase [Desulfurivibrio alkaliphilus]MDF1613397.1 NUDIX hydrolase [Desulfurivibrio alkaliphilus]
MSKTIIQCPKCGHAWPVWHNPRPTVDIIIETEGGIVLIKRKTPPAGWALPGGFVDYGESLEAAAIREASEETGLTVRLRRQLHTYSDPNRDSRAHTISTVFLAESVGGTLQAGDDAARAAVFPLDSLPDLVFDHNRMVADYRQPGR